MRHHAELSDANSPAGGTLLAVIHACRARQQDIRFFMKDTIIALLEEALSALQQQGELPQDIAPTIKVDPTKDKAHGDFATNLALMLAKPAGKKPRELAEALVAALPASPAVSKTEIAGPGFINFFAATDALAQVVSTILDSGDAYGRCLDGKGEKVQVEFVSANPTASVACWKRPAST